MPFKIYRSSAGSGKTFTLVKEYLRIALGSHGDTAYRGILAITFTNKAAEEMKGRVISTLKELSDQSLEVGHMGKMLQQELNLDAITLSQRADRVLRSMLHNYADLSISTIDSFTHRVIRTFAQDFGLPVNFEVEMDTDRLILSLTDRLLAEVGIEKGITDALIDLSLAQAEDEKSWSIDDALKDMAKTIFNEEGRFHLEGMKGIAMADFIALRKRLQAALHNDKAILLATAQAAVALIKTNNLEIGHIAGGANGVAGYLDKISKGKFDAAHNKADEYVEQGTWHGSKAKGIEKAAIDGIAAQLQQAYETVLAVLARRKRLSFILKNVYGIALLERMSEIVHTLQEEQEVLHIGEFNHLVGEVVMREQAPFIYERLGYRYHHFLVDEFQDTNVLQWFNLLPLIDESLATDGLCLVVGDAKQSIYRWRGGEVQQFVSLPAVHRADYLNDQLANDTVLAEMLDQREQSLQTHVEEHSLQSNFRTLPEVVHFNNVLFTDLQQHMPEALQSMYDGVAQATPKGKEGGLVCIRYIPRPEKENSFGDYRPITLDQIKVWVDECLEDGYEPGDIAIISRVNDRGVEVAQFLIEEGYNVVSNESLLINSSPYVRLLVNVAVFLVNKHDTTNMAELVQHLCMARKEENLVSERLALVGKEKSSGVYQLLKSLYPDVLWNRMRQLPIYGLFEQLRFHLLDGVKQPHLIYFMDEVLEFSRKEGNDINGFMRYWIEHRGKRSIALTENRDAIRILSVHKSKGLEFPVVIHPFADYDADTKRNSIWLRMEDEDAKPLDRLFVKASQKTLEGTVYEPDLEKEQHLTTMDMFNMLYVALTRPKNRLYVCGKVKDEGKEKEKPTPSAFGFLMRSLQARGFVFEDEQCTIGQRVQAIPHAPDNRIYLQLRDTGSPDWMERIAIAHPSRQECGDSTARNYGILIHDALAHVHAKADVTAAVKMLVQNGRLPETEAQSLEKQIALLIKRPELSALFAQGATVRTEADIQMPGGKWLRPDRVVTTANTAYVVDYKTGTARPEHHKQIASYKDALMALGFQKVEGVLVYMESGEIEQIQ